LITPRAGPRGTSWHPHRGFETVTYMLDGIFRHQDSNGGGGLISDGDIQWMTAVYSSSESLTGDLEAYHDAGVLQVYDAQARYLP
jgi:Pirin